MSGGLIELHRHPLQLISMGLDKTRDAGAAVAACLAEEDRSRDSLVNSIRNALGIHLLEELGVRLGFAQLTQQELDGVDRTHRVENASKNIHLLQNIG